MPLTSTLASNTSHALGEFYSFSLDYLVIGGGGGGGGSGPSRFGGGGGAGDLVQTATFATGGATSPKLSGITPGTVLTIVQGIAGFPGTGGSPAFIGVAGGNSFIAYGAIGTQKIIVANGGGGGGPGGTSGTNGGAGGSGGGGGKASGVGGSASGTNVYAGGTAASGTGAGAGGGGAGGAGASAATGGAGLANTITGTSVTYSIGGSAGSTSGPSTYGCGGYASNAALANGAIGNWGVVIISWLASAYNGTPKFNGTVPPTVQTNGIYKYVVFDLNITNSSTITF